MNKIAHISVCDNRKTYFTGIEKAFAFFNIFAWNFPNQCIIVHALAFGTLFIGPNFSFRPLKTFGGQILKFAVQNIQNLAPVGGWGPRSSQEIGHMSEFVWQLLSRKTVSQTNQGEIPLLKTSKNSMNQPLPQRCGSRCGERCTRTPNTSPPSKWLCESEIVGW